MAKDYYKILGINKTASAEEIKKAFRELAHKYHPDKAGGDEGKFKEINEAYQVLSNPQKRQQYDQYGQTFEQARSQGGFSGFDGFRDFSDFASAFGGKGRQGDFSFEFNDLGDIFGDLFGFGGRSKGQAQRTAVGSDIEVGITIDFKEAAFGTEKVINFDKDEICSHCGGNGAEPGSKISTCPECHGSGQVSRQMAFGIAFAAVCPTCGGSGKKAEKNCSQCHGKGIVKDKKTIKVKIPAGIDDGQVIRLSGEGQAASRNGRAGDLYLKIRVLPHQEFRRDGYNILSRLDISFPQAALGDKISVNTLEGSVKLKIPEGTQTGRTFILRGRGVPHLHGRGRGDQLIKVIVKTPTQLSRRQKELLKELGETRD